LRNILYIALSALLFAACENSLDKINLLTPAKKLPMLSQKNTEVIYSDSGDVVMKLLAVELNRYDGEKPYVEMPKGIKMYFFNGVLDTTTRLYANYAVKYDTEHTMEAKGNVIIINEKNEKLNTEHIIWDDVKKKIYTKGFVRITTANEIIMGDGLESNQTFTKYKITKIKGIINLKDEAS
jgi:LPS export ABC transporter protein LptC